MTNNEIKIIQSLDRKKVRQEMGQFFIEGKRLVQSALEFQRQLHEVFVTDLFLKDHSDFGDVLQNSGVKLTQISSKVMDKLSFTKSPSGAAAVCALPTPTLCDTSQEKWLYLDHVSDPGNLGTLFRSAAWFGFRHVALSTNCVDPYNPKVVRSGMGAHFGLSIHSDILLNQFFDSHTLIGADHHGTPVERFSVPENFVLVLGNEAHGLTDETKAHLNEIVAIAKRGFGESLNVSVAGAILMERFTR